MKQNHDLLIAIRDAGMTQCSFAEVVGDHPSLISRVIRGYANIDADRKEKWSKALGKDVHEIFTR